MKNQIILDNVNSNLQNELELNVNDLNQSISTTSGLHSRENIPSTNQVKICTLNIFKILILF